MIGGIVILASREYYFIIVHENLVEHPSNNISIIEIHNEVILLLFYVISLMDGFMLY